MLVTCVEYAMDTIQVNVSNHGVRLVDGNGILRPRSKTSYHGRDMLTKLELKATQVPHNRKLLVLGHLFSLSLQVMQSHLRENQRDTN